MLNNLLVNVFLVICFLVNQSTSNHKSKPLISANELEVIFSQYENVAISKVVEYEIDYFCLFVCFLDTTNLIAQVKQKVQHLYTPLIFDL